MEPKKSWELQSASWRLRGADGVVSVWRPASLRPSNSQGFSTSPKAGKSWRPSSRQSGRKKESDTPLFYSGPEQIEKAHHIREGNQFNLKLIEKLPYETSKMMFDQLGAISWPSQVDT